MNKKVDKVKVEKNLLKCLFKKIKKIKKIINKEILLYSKNNNKIKLNKKNKFIYSLKKKIN